MNVMRTDLLDPAEAAPLPDSGEPRREVMRLMRLVRRNWITILLSAFAALALGAAFVAVVEPSYRSTVRILLDQNRTGEASDTASLQQGTNVDEYIATQVALIQSDVVMRRVAEGLPLTEDGMLRAALPGEGGPSTASAPQTQAAEEERRVLDAVRRMVSVYRLDRSFVIEIAATSPDAALSQRIADAAGSAYIADQSESYARSLTQAGDWLEERIEDLRQQSLQASEAVERFRAESGILATEGQLISDQQLTGLSTQSVLAEANAARLQSRYDVYNAAIQSGDIATLTGLLVSGEPGETSVGTAAGDYLVALERERAVTTDFGGDNAQLPAIRAEIERLSRLVLVEARGRLAAYENELQAARAQLGGIEDSMVSAATRSQSSNLPLVQLRSLEQRANSLQTLYQTYLTRYQETLQRQSLPLNGARKISDAEEAARPVFPNTKIVLAFALVMGLGLGGALSLGREFFDNSLRTAEQLRRLGIETIGHAPRMRGKGTPSRRHRLQMDRLHQSLVSALRIVPGRGPRVVAVVSGRRGEGRTFMADALATAFEEQGYRVATLDLSAEAPKSAQSGEPSRRWLPFFGRKASGGSRHATPSRQPSVRDSVRNLQRVLPRQAEGQWPDALAASDVVVVDPPPLHSAVELRAIAEVADSVIVVVEWGYTDADQMREMLASGSSFRSKVAGAVFTKVVPRLRRRYEPGSSLLNG